MSHSLQKRMPQVSPVNYCPSNYDEFHRWASYWYQIRAVMRAAPKTVLEIGCGTGVVSHYLRERLKMKVTTFDFDPALAPDIVGDVRELNQYFDLASFDCVCAFQVLEHIPYKDFQPCLAQMNQVTRRAVVISLPYWGYFLQLRLRLFKQRYTLAFGRKITRPFTWQFNGQHYWEIGTREYPLQRVVDAVVEILEIERHYFCPDHPYHYFFECRKNGR